MIFTVRALSFRSHLEIIANVSIGLSWGNCHKKTRGGESIYRFSFRLALKILGWTLSIPYVLHPSPSQTSTTPPSSSLLPLSPSPPLVHYLLPPPLRRAETYSRAGCAYLSMSMWGRERESQSGSRRWKVKGETGLGLCFVSLRCWWWGIYWACAVGRRCWGGYWARLFRVSA